MLSASGVSPKSKVWRSYCLVCRNLVSVPCRRSSTPKTPKHWLNLESTGRVQKVRTSRRPGKVARKTDLRWWKSWNSGEGRKGRWYPQWETVVLTSARQYHMHVLDTCEPSSTGPITTGSRLEN